MAEFTPEPGTYNFAKVLDSESQEIERLCQDQKAKLRVRRRRWMPWGVAGR